MKASILAVLLLSTGALAQSSLPVFTKDVGPSAAATQTANSAAGNLPVYTDGASIGGMTGLNVILSAASGQTLSGAGTLRFWLCDDRLARCARNAEADITITTSSVRTLTFNGKQLAVAGKGQRVYVEAVSVTSSGGALTVTIQTWKTP